MRVSDPRGREWRVGRQWLPAWARVRSRDFLDGSGLGDVGDALGLDDAGAGIFMVLAVLVLGALVLMVVVPIIALTLEVLIIVVVFAGSLIGRIVLRRPWHVIARSGTSVFRWPVRGWRASGARVREVADSLAAGRVPDGAEPVSGAALEI